uniref:Secreted protein n=1 Tax=Ascaris lumbricoides TaxID=6252 RepID=A0A0M3HWE1_ASCLU
MSMLSALINVVVRSMLRCLDLASSIMKIKTAPKRIKTEEHFWEVIAPYLQFFYTLNCNALFA